MSALPPKADVCGATRDVRYGPKADIGEQAPKLVFLWAVLQTLQRFGNGVVEIGLEIGRGLHGKMPSRPLAKGERGRAFKAISPWNAATTGHYLRPICRVHWAVHTWERGQPREPLSRTCRCSITVLPTYRPFCQSRSETRRLGAGA